MKKKVLNIVLISIFAVLLWGFISLSNEYNTVIKTDVKISNIPQEYSLSNISNEKLIIRVKGQGWELAKLVWGPDKDFEIPILDSGLKNIKIRDYLETNLPSTISVEKVVPENIEIEIEKSFTKKLPIKSNLILDFKDGYGRVSDIIIYPDSLEISGPKSIISEMNFVGTEVLEFEELEQSVTQKMNINKIPNVNYNIDKVNIEFEVQKIVDKTFEDILVKTTNVKLGQELILFPAKIQVVLRGGLNVLADLESEDIQAEVSFIQAERDSLGSLIPNVDYPPNTTLIKTIPSKLKYVIKQF